MPKNVTVLLILKKRKEKMLHGFTLMTLIFIGFLKLLNDAIPPSLQFPPGLTWWIFFKIQIQIFFILRTEKPPEILHFY